MACAAAEPPSGYNYNRPSGGGGGGGFSSGGFSSGGFSSGGGGSGLIGGGGYTAVSSGYQTSEGQQVDPVLLEQIKQILLREESQGGGGGGGGHGGISSPSSSYGVPSSSYGVPSYNSRVVGIEIGHVQPALQVAQYEQHGGSSGGGYPAARAPSGSYGAPY